MDSHLITSVTTLWLAAAYAASHDGYLVTLKDTTPFSIPDR